MGSHIDLASVTTVENNTIIMSSCWLNGSYKLVLAETRVFGTCVVDGNKVTCYGRTFNDEKGDMFWEVGDFGEAEDKVKEITGTTNNNIKISSANHKGKVHKKFTLSLYVLSFLKKSLFL